MGNCCEEPHRRAFESVDVPRINEYEESSWPAEDYFLKEKLQASKIANLESKEKPLKHKIYDCWYWGDWSNGQPMGKGIIYNKTHNKSIYYEGDFDGEPNGQGKFVLNQGESEYAGEVRKGKANGKGHYKNNYEDYEFTGNWIDSVPEEGHLTVTKKNLTTGKKEKTEIDLNKPNQPSRIKYPDGRIYLGEIHRQKFVPHGHGRVNYPNLSWYDGEWKQGEMHGKGKFKWHDGSSYDGEYQRNKKHGKGRFVFTSGNYFEGLWEDGHQHGKGIMFNNKDQELEKGVWKHGEFFGHL